MEPQIIQSDNFQNQLSMLPPGSEEPVKKDAPQPRAATKPQFIQTDYPKDQLLLLPPSVDEFVEQDETARHLRTLLSQLNVEAFQDRCKGGGRPSYDPVALISIIVFGMFDGVRSSRKLHKACIYDLRYKFLAQTATPDFRTILRFRASNEESIYELYLKTVKLASVADMIDLKHVSIDGTKIEANAAKHKFRSDKELDELIKKASEVAQSLLDEWKHNDDKDDNDDEPPKAVVSAQDIVKRLQDAKKILADREQAQGIVITDPDSRMMKHKSGIRPGYNGQAVVDSKCQMIIAAELVQDEGDNQQFEPMVEAAFKNLEKFPEKVSADGGYWSAEALKYTDEKKLDAYIAPSGIDPASLVGWTYDEAADTYTGPNGDIYTFEKKKCSGKKNGKNRNYRIYRCKETGTAKWMQDGIPNYSEMQKKTSTPEGVAVYKWRKAIIEPVFGHIKVAYGFRRMHLRGLSGARTEYMLACLTHNISKLIKNRAMIPSAA